MNTVTISIGLIALAIGLYVLFLRIKDPSKLAKLEKMKEAMGEKSGGVVHFIFYTLLPILAGGTFIWLGSQGVALF